MSKSRFFCQTRSLIPMVKNETVILFLPIMSKSRCFCQTRSLIPMVKNENLFLFRLIMRRVVASVRPDT